jgi:choline dehydrogenase-like flavoprotein
VIRDLRDGSGSAEVEADVCLVGGGAAAIAIASRLAGSKLRVALLEAGGLASENATQALYRGESVGPPRQPLDASRLRYLGGSTNHWAGLCGPLRERDFRPRPWLPHSGWPLGLEELAPWYREAWSLCGVDPGALAPDLASALGRPLPPIGAETLTPFLLHYTPALRFGEAFRPLLQGARNVEVVLHANATHLQASPDAGRVEHVAFRSLEGRAGVARARAYVLCCGGVENARLLLLSDDIEPAGLGNRRDVVGRFFMDHPFVRTGEVVQTGAAPLEALYSDFARADLRYRPAFALAEALERDHELTGCSAYLWRSDDHRSDATRAARRLADAAARAEWPPDLAHDVAAVARDLGGLYEDAFAADPPAPRPPRLEILCLLEQPPDPASRIVLSDHRDALGLRGARLEWRLGERERRTLEVMTDAIAAELGRLGLGRVRVDHWLAEHDGWGKEPVDYNHHMGATRMSDDPADGVVDASGRVHGVANLYVAGSSVFPTGGITNPTLTIVALALRLADHLRSAFGGSGTTATIR